MDVSLLIANVVDSKGFVEEATKSGLIVIGGGFLGGFLQPIYAKINPQSENPPSINFLFSPLLGVAAAGISVYVVANSNTDEPMRLLFFSLLCGLAFPAVLTSAVDNLGRKTATVQKDVASAAEKAKSEGLKETVEAAKDLKDTLGRNPPDSLKPSGQQAIEATAQQAVSNIAQTAVDDPKSLDRIVKELQDVRAVAETAGWEGTAEAADEQLKKLSEEGGDKKD